MDYNPVLEHLGSEISDYPVGIQVMLGQMGELMERMRRMILDYNAWASIQPNQLDCISLLKGMQMRPGYRPDLEGIYSPTIRTTNQGVR